MKKISKLLILSVAALTCFTSCQPENKPSEEQSSQVEQSSEEQSSEQTISKEEVIASAADLLWQDCLKIDRQEITGDINLPKSINIAGKVVNISWAHQILEGNPGDGVTFGDGIVGIDYFGKLISNQTPIKVQLSPSLSYEGTTVALGDALDKPARNNIAFTIPVLVKSNHADWIAAGSDKTKRINIEGTVVDIVDPTSSSGSKGSFYMIDDDGHGYYVYQPNVPGAGHAKSGDRVIVSGTRSDYSGQEEFARYGSYGVLSEGNQASLTFKNATADWEKAKSSSSSDAAFATSYETASLTVADIAVNSSGDKATFEFETSSTKDASKPVVTVDTDGVYAYTKNSVNYFSFHKGTAEDYDSIKITAPEGLTIANVELTTSGTYDNLDWYIGETKVTETKKTVSGNLVSSVAANANEVSIINPTNYYVNGMSLKVTLANPHVNYQNNLVELNGCVPSRIDGSYYYFTVGEGETEFNIYDTYYFLSNDQRDAFKAAWDSAWNEGKTITVKGVSTVYSSKYQVYGSSLAPEIITVDGELTADEKHAYVEKLIKSAVADNYKEDKTIDLPTLPEYASVSYELTAPTENATASLETKDGKTSIKVARSDKETVNTVKATVTIDGVEKSFDISVKTQPKLAPEFYLTGEITKAKVTTGAESQIDATNENKETVKVSILTNDKITESQGDFKVEVGGTILITAPEGHILDTVEVDSNGNYNSLDFYTDAEKGTRFDDGNQNGFDNEYRSDNNGRTLTTIPVNGASLLICNDTENYNAYSKWIKITVKKVA